MKRLRNNPLSKKQWWKQVTDSLIRSELKNPFVRRVPDRYLRDRAIWKLSQEIDETTGKKKYTASEIANEFNPLNQSLSEEDRIWWDKKNLFEIHYGKSYGNYEQPKNKWQKEADNGESRKFDRWIDRYNDGLTGDAVRKIINRFKKRLKH